MRAFQFLMFQHICFWKFVSEDPYQEKRLVKKIPFTNLTFGLETGPNLFYSILESEFIILLLTNNIA